MHKSLPYEICIYTQNQQLQIHTRAGPSTTTAHTTHQRFIPRNVTPCIASATCACSAASSSSVQGARSVPATDVLRPFAPLWGLSHLRSSCSSLFWGREGQRIVVKWVTPPFQKTPLSPTNPNTKPHRQRCLASSSSRTGYISPCSAATSRVPAGAAAIRDDSAAVCVCACGCV